MRASGKLIVLAAAVVVAAAIVLVGGTSARGAREQAARLNPLVVRGRYFRSAERVTAPGFGRLRAAAQAVEVKVPASRVCIREIDGIKLGVRSLGRPRRYRVRLYDPRDKVVLDHRGLATPPLEAMAVQGNARRHLPHRLQPPRTHPPLPHLALGCA